MAADVPQSRDADAIGASGRFQWRDVVRRAPRAVWLIVVVHTLLLLFNTALFPNHRSPDEPLHVDLIAKVQLGEAWPWPDPGTVTWSKGVTAGGFIHNRRLTGQLHLADQDIPPRHERPSYQEAGGNLSAGWPNQLIQHPPLYYVLGAGILTLIPDWADIPFDRVLLLLRFWNIVLIAPMPLLAYALARRMRLRPPGPLLAALSPLALPQLHHIGSAVNNDNLATMLLAVATVLVGYVLTGDTSRQTAVWLGGVSALALLTKGFALVLPAMIATAYLLAALRGRRRSTLGSLAVALVIAGVGGLWWLRNKLVYGTVQPHGTKREPPNLPATFGWEDGGPEWARFFLDRMSTTFFLEDQTGQVPHGSTWLVARIALILLVLGIGLTLATRTLRLLDAAVLAMVFVGQLAIVTKGSWEAFAASQRYGAMQGRYLFGGAIGILVIALAWTYRLPHRIRHWTPLAFAVAIGCMYTVFVGAQLNALWVSKGTSALTPSGAAGAVRAIFEWWALPPALLVFIMASLVAAAAVGFLGLVRIGRTAPAPVSVRIPLRGLSMTVGAEQTRVDHSL